MRPGWGANPDWTPGYRRPWWRGGGPWRPAPPRVPAPAVVPEFATEFAMVESTVRLVEPGLPRGRRRQRGLRRPVRGVEVRAPRPVVGVAIVPPVGDALAPPFVPEFPGHRGRVHGARGDGRGRRLPGARGCGIARCDGGLGGRRVAQVLGRRVEVIPGDRGARRRR